MNKKVLFTFLTVVAYASAFYGIQFFLNKIGMVTNVPNHENLALWDGGWYKSICQQGYVHGNGPSNTGFFILFPIIWKFSHLGTWGICLLNVLLLATGFAILAKIYDTDVHQQLIWLSTPSFFFFFVAYSEALFFLLMTMCLYGIKFNKKWLIWIGLFLSSLTRATAVSFISSLLIMELLGNDRRNWLQSIKTYLVDYALPLLLGLGTFIWYQHSVTGIWFEYFKQQSSHWDRKFAIPLLPFGSTEGNRTIWLSALAFFVTLIAIISLIILIVKWITKNIKQDKLLVLSFCYLISALFLSIFFNPRWSGTTDVMGLHRYALVTPFFIVFLHHYTQNREAYKIKDYVFVFFISNLVWLSFGSYNHILHLLFYNFNTALIFVYMLLANKKLNWPALIIFGINIMLQIQLFQQFINPLYPD